MATTTTFYNSYKKDVLAGNIDWENDTIKVALCTSSYTPDIDAHSFFDDITNEVSGTGYTAGGATLTTSAPTQDNTDNEGVADATDISWASSTIAARYAIVYKSTGTPATSPLIQYIDLGQDYTSSNGTLEIQWNSEGIINVN